MVMLLPLLRYVHCLSACGSWRQRETNTPARSFLALDHATVRSCTAHRGDAVCCPCSLLVSPGSLPHNSNTLSNHACNCLPCDVISFLIPGLCFVGKSRSRKSKVTLAEPRPEAPSDRIEGTTAICCSAPLYPALPCPALPGAHSCSMCTVCVAATAQRARARGRR